MPLAARDGHPGLRVPARAPADGTVPFAAATAIPQLAAAAPAAGFAVSPAPITGVTCPERLLPHAVLTEGFPVVGGHRGRPGAPNTPPAVPPQPPPTREQRFWPPRPPRCPPPGPPRWANVG